jgi:hypothetical protein
MVAEPDGGSCWEIVLSTVPSGVACFTAYRNVAVALQLVKREARPKTITVLKNTFCLLAKLYDFGIGDHMRDETNDVTHLLKAWSGGNPEALDELTPKVYLELRRMAARSTRREAAGNSLPATALVHEVFLRLVDVDSVNWQDRAHFFAVSANMMRRILVDRARAKGMTKRGAQPPTSTSMRSPRSPRTAETGRSSQSMKHSMPSRRSTRAKPK